MAKVISENSVIHKIRTRITRSKNGEVFFVSSFPKYDVGYVTKLLAQFEREGLVSRLAKGVYVKAEKTPFGLAYPSAYELVSAIAKRDKAKIMPTGATAENRLGFSTQVPVNTIFLTTGSSRILLLGGRKITLKHAAPKNFAYKGKMVPELVQALRSIGKKNVTPVEERNIRRLLTLAPETDTIGHDLVLAPVWIRELIMKNMP